MSNESNTVLPVAHLTLLNDSILPVEVEFDRHEGRYKNLACALRDVEYFRHTPAYDDWRLKAEAEVRELQDGPDWYRTGPYA